MSVKEKPELQRIQNPAAQFQVGAGIEVTGYVIQEEAWRERATQLVDKSLIG